MKTTPLLLLGTGALAAAGWLCTYQVNESEAVILTRFGEPKEPVDEPGLHFKWPSPLDLVNRVDCRVRLLDPEAAEFLTGDKKNIEVDSLIAWRVADPLTFFTRLGAVEVAEARLEDVAMAELGNLLGAHDMSDLVSVAEAQPTAVDLGVVNGELTERVAAAVHEIFGIEVVLARIKRLNFPKQNKNAVFRRMEAEREKIAAEIRSQGREQAENLRSDAMLEASLLLSEAGRLAEEVRGKGEAEAAGIYNRAYGENPELFEFLESLATIESTLGEGDLFVLPHDHWLLRALDEDPGTGASPDGTNPQ